MKRTAWRKCEYGKRWGEKLPKEVMEHPAKFPRGPLEKFVDYGIEQGWWSKGDFVVDPMCGVATGGVVFSERNIRWWGMELDEKYASLARKTIDHLRTNSYFLGLPLPDFQRGDARNLSEYMNEPADAVVFSPPYGEMLKNPGGCRSTQKTGVSHFHNPEDGYGSANGQIGKLSYAEHLDAMFVIYYECYSVLRSGGILASVVRNYSRNKKLVQLSRDTNRLLSECGFEPVIHIRMMMNGHASMFRRMNKERGVPTSDFDHFLVWRKP